MTTLQIRGQRQWSIGQVAYQWTLTKKKKKQKNCKHLKWNYNGILGQVNVLTLARM